MGSMQADRGWVVVFLHCITNIRQASSFVMLADDNPPEYDFDVCLPPPVYSLCVGSAERLLQFAGPGAIECPGDWIYETKHMKINMGSQVWGLHAPSYGLHGKIEGFVQFSDDQNRVQCVEVMVKMLFFVSCVG